MADQLDDFIGRMLAQGHSKEAVLAALHAGKDTGVFPQSQIARGMRPDTGGMPRRGEGSGGGPAEDLDARPAFDPSGETARLQRQIRSGPPGEDVSRASARARSAGDPLTGGGDIDPTSSMVLGGVASMGAGALARLAPGIRTLIQGGPVARAVGGAGVGAAEAETANVTQGGNVIPREPSDFLTLLTGMAGRAAGGFSAGVRAPGARTEQIIGDIKASGGKPGLPGQRSAVGGMYDSPDYRSLPEGDAGTMRMAEESVNRVRGGVDNRMADARSGLDQGEAAARTAVGKGSVYTAPAILEIDSMINELSPNGVETSPGTVATLKRFREALTRPTGAPEIGFDDLRAVIKQANEAAKFGADPTLKGSYGKRLSGSLAQLQRGIAPEMDTALDQFAQTARSSSRVNDAMMGKRAPQPEMTAARRSTAVSRMSDVGRETKTAQNRTARMEQAGVDPAELQRMKGRNAAEAIRFGMPNAGRPNITAESFVRRNLPAAQIRVAEPLGRAADVATHPALLPAEALALRRFLGLADDDDRVKEAPGLTGQLKSMAEKAVRPVIQSVVREELQQQEDQP